MDRRFVLFLVLSFGILFGHAYFTQRNQIRQKNQQQQKQADGAKNNIPGDDGKGLNGKGLDGKNDDKPAGLVSKDNQTTDGAPGKEPAPEEAAAPPGEIQAANAQEPGNWFSIGSIDPKSGYRMLVTLVSRGAALERVEFSSPRFHELDVRYGYLGNLAEIDTPDNSGAIVQLVGLGTPAHTAGIQPDDIITKVDSTRIRSAADLPRVLQATKPGETVSVVVRRGEMEKTLSVGLVRNPLSVIRPEMDTRVDTAQPGIHDPLSLLLDINYLDNVESDEDGKLGGLDPRNQNWSIAHASERMIEFTLDIPGRGLQLVKRYRIAPTPSESIDDPSYASYHLDFEVEIRNVDSKVHRISYRLDGPNGLPTEGWWYAHKISPKMFTAGGLRDLAVSFVGARPTIFPRSEVVKETDTVWKEPLIYAGVDAQYFSAALLPQKNSPEEQWFSEVRPMVVGKVPEDKTRAQMTNVSFRLASETNSIDPQQSLTHKFKLFIGPKRPALLDQYGPVGSSLNHLVYYGWFGWVARPMLFVLHLFYSIVGNYGVAIVMLTVLVRSCMLPLSRKQALASKKMQELQPEIKRISEKYKANVEQRTRAQQELFKKHNYNPFGGCLLAFIQLPIFLGLYRSLMVDVELRQAPLLSSSIRWCSNLSAPDMLFNWEPLLPFLTSPTGWLGPFLNVLPLITVGLFLWQTTMFMPPPTDEQTAMQQKMMKFMTLFMGLLFFKVASGLCLYFIASSTWGIVERTMLPKSGKAGSSPPVVVKKETTNSKTPKRNNR